MKKMITILGIFTITLISLGAVANDNFYSDRATVISVDPIYREYTISKPYKDCYIRNVYVPQEQTDDGSVTNELVGGIIGGAIGNQFGRGSGKDALTVAGALLGASIANDTEHNSIDGYYKEQRICDTKYEYSKESRLSHYLVRYEYAGEEYTYKSDKKLDANDVINVRIDITPTY